MENKSQTIVLSLKYVLLAILTGVLVGIIDTVFGRGLLTISDFRTGHYLYLIPFLPFAGLLIVWLYHHFSETSLKGIGCMDTPSKGSVMLEGRKLEDLNAKQLADVRKNMIEIGRAHV